MTGLVEINVGLLNLLCEQGEYDAAALLVDRFAARIDHEIAVAAEAANSQKEPSDA